MMMNEKTWQLRITLTADPCPFCFGSGLEARFDGQTLTITAYFSVSDHPLVLEAPAKTGDTVRFVYQPWRMELWVNDSLLDEEWPYGEPCFDEPSGAEPVPEQPAQPSVLGSFVGAEGWRPGGGVFVGDCMPYVFADRFHVLWLKDRRHHGSKWHKGAHQWGHLSTADLVHWQIHPMAVEIDDPAEASICTGSWIYHNGLHQLYYTIRTTDGSPAPICRSISEDGWHFRKDKAFRFTLSETYTGVSARDPKVFLGADGQMHMFVTTRLTQSRRGCLAHLSSADGERWTELEPIYVSPEPDQQEPECSDYFSIGDRYYLVFSELHAPQYRYSDQPFTGWKTPNDPIIPCHSVPKAGIWNDRLIFAGFVAPPRSWGGTMTFLEAAPDESGELHYFPVREMEG